MGSFGHLYVVRPIVGTGDSTRLPGVRSQTVANSAFDSPDFRSFHWSGKFDLPMKGVGLISVLKLLSLNDPHPDDGGMVPRGQWTSPQGSLPT